MVRQQLAELKIFVPDRLGEHRTTCPNCSHLRSKKRDRCLSVKIDADGAQYNCWHCGFSGGFFANDLGGSNRVGRKARDQRGDFGVAGRRLRYGMVS